MIHDFIDSLPDKYNTRVGENGIFLSGGQKQRLGIARALYQDKDLIFLDISFEQASKFIVSAGTSEV